MIRIVFDKDGKPSWQKYKPEHQAVIDFTEKEKAWFRKPLAERMEATD